MMGLKTPIVSVIVGEGGSGGALAGAHRRILRDCGSGRISVPGWNTVKTVRKRSEMGFAAEYKVLTRKMVAESGQLNPLKL